MTRDSPIPPSNNPDPPHDHHQHDHQDQGCPNKMCSQSQSGNHIPRSSESLDGSILPQHSCDDTTSNNTSPSIETLRLTIPSLDHSISTAQPLKNRECSRLAQEEYHATHGQRLSRSLVPDTYDLQHRDRSPSHQPDDSTGPSVSELDQKHAPQIVTDNEQGRIAPQVAAHITSAPIHPPIFSAEEIHSLSMYCLKCNSIERHWRCGDCQNEHISMPFEEYVDIHSTVLEPTWTVQYLNTVPTNLAELGVHLWRFQQQLCYANNIISEARNCVLRDLTEKHSAESRPATLDKARWKQVCRLPWNDKLRPFEIVASLASRYTHNFIGRLKKEFERLLQKAFLDQVEWQTSQFGNKFAVLRRGLRRSWSDLSDDSDISDDDEPIWMLESIALPDNLLSNFVKAIRAHEKNYARKMRALENNWSYVIAQYPELWMNLTEEQQRTANVLATSMSRLYLEAPEVAVLPKLIMKSVFVENSHHFLELEEVLAIRTSVAVSRDSTDTGAASVRPRIQQISHVTADSPPQSVAGQQQTAPQPRAVQAPSLSVPADTSSHIHTGFQEAQSQACLVDSQSVSSPSTSLLPHTLSREQVSLQNTQMGPPREAQTQAHLSEARDRAPVRQPTALVAPQAHQQRGFVPTFVTSTQDSGLTSNARPFWQGQAYIPASQLFASQAQGVYQQGTYPSISASQPSGAGQIVVHPNGCWQGNPHAQRPPYVPSAYDVYESYRRLFALPAQAAHNPGTFPNTNAAADVGQNPTSTQRPPDPA